MRQVIQVKPPGHPVGFRRPRRPWMAPLRLLALSVLAALWVSGCKGGKGGEAITGDYVIYHVSGDGGVVRVEARSKEKGKGERVSFVYDGAVGGWRKCVYWPTPKKSYRNRKGGHCKIDKMEVRNKGRLVGNFTMNVTGFVKGKESRVSGSLEASGRQGFLFRKQFGF